MSYRRTYRKRIAVPYSGYVTCHYGASQSGGSKDVHYSGTAYEDVEVEIEVDTLPFERGVEHCNDHVDALTGSVVAAEAAQVASIKATGRQIGDTIVDGFFSTVRFEISTQITELTKRVEALLMDIREKQAKLLALKAQMEKDYNRTAERYGKIFDELNKELDNRVHALDQPVFTVAGNMYQAEDRFAESDMLNIVALAGKENAALDAQISAALAKDHAHAALNEANVFLAKKQATEITLSHSKLDSNEEHRFYAPVCCIYAPDEHNVMANRAYSGDFLPKQLSQDVAKELDFTNLPEMTQEQKESIDLYFRNLLNDSNVDSEHANRVKNTISKLYSI